MQRIRSACVCVVLFAFLATPSYGSEADILLRWMKYEYSPFHFASLAIYFPVPSPMAEPSAKKPATGKAQPEKKNPN